MTSPINRYALDELEAVMPDLPEPERHGRDGEEALGNAYEIGCSSADLLERNGWHFHGHGPDGIEYYTRPGKERGVSAAVMPDGKIYVHTSSSTLPERETLTPFWAMTLLEHGGDASRCRARLAQEGLRGSSVTDEQVLEYLTAVGAPSASEEDEENPLIKRLVWGAEVLRIPPKAPLIDGWIDQGDLGVCYGAPGVGKSFLAIDIAGCVAAGMEWHGCSVAQGRVLYVAAEGSAGIPRRWQAWLDHHGLGAEDVPDMVWLPHKVRMRDPATVSHMVDAARHVGAKLVIIDTLARTFGGGNENSAEDMGLYIDGADAIKDRAGATVLLIHHSGKDGAAGARGSTALLGAVDVELQVRAEQGKTVSISSTKQKDKEAEAPVVLALRKRGESVILDDPTQEDADNETVGSALAESALGMLREMAGSEGVSSSAWLESFIQEGAGQRRAFFKAKKALETGGHVRNIGTPARPRWVPVARDLYLVEGGPDDLS